MSQLRLTNLYLNARLLSLGSMRLPGLQDINVIMFTEACKSLESHKDEINPRPQLLQLSQQRDDSPMSTVHMRVEINTVLYSFILEEIILLFSDGCVDMTWAAFVICTFNHPSILHSWPQRFVWLTLAATGTHLSLCLSLSCHLYDINGCNQL